ncbi:MAG: ABC transporter permease subunit [Oscillospiraceae bacterium]|nr:ABC transporter permease subunit [Oscillospiraceae bacterium]
MGKYMMKELISTYGSMLLNAIVTHTIYVVICVAIGFVLGLVLGVALSRIPRWAGVIMPVISVFQTIPGLVFIGILFLWLGMVPATVIIALSIYALFPVLKNTYAGLLSIDPKYIEAAKGCGMSAMQSILRVELPLAMPTIIAGLRMSTDIYRFLDGSGLHDRPGRTGGFHLSGHCLQ